MKKSLALLLALMLSASSVFAEGVPLLINFQGKLLNTSNNPESGAIAMQFRIFTAVSGGTLLWGPESQTPTVTNGVFAVQLGAVTALSTDVFVGGSAFLSVTVSPDVFPGGEMTPRQQLISSPFAYTAAQLSQNSDIRINAGVVYSTFSQSGNLFVPNGIQSSTGTFTATGVNSSIITSSGIIVNGANTAVQAPFFIGNGSLLTGIGSALTAGSVDTSDIATDAVIDSSILAGTITGAKIAAGTINSTNILAGTIGSAQISGTAGITGAQIAAGTIGTANLGVNSVTSAAILNGTITSADIANGAINTGLIATDAVIDSSILSATITNDKLAGTIDTVVVLPRPGATGALTAAAPGNTTTAIVALFNVPERIVVNQLTYSIAATGNGGTYKVCVYNEANTTKVIDVTSGANAIGLISVAVAGVTLIPGNYFVLVGGVTATTATMNKYTSAAVTGFTTTIPAGKKALEGTLTRTSAGNCDATLNAITPAIDSTPIVRFDN